VNPDLPFALRTSLRATPLIPAISFPMRKIALWFGHILRVTLSINQTLAAFACVAAVCAVVPAKAADSSAPNVPLTGQRVLVLGDSITQDGRYVSFFEYALLRATPTIRCDLISVGLSSETISGLSEKGHPYPRPCVFERLDRALKEVKPTVVFACYGMNDGIYHPASPERIAAFESGLHRFIAAIRATGAQLVLVTPPIFDPKPVRSRVAPASAAEFGYNAPFEDYDNVLAEFSRIENALHEDGVTVIDLHSAMSAALATRRQQTPDFSFSTDGIHPGDTGHALMAQIILTALHLPIPSELNASADLSRLKDDPFFKLVDERRRLRSEAWLSFVGYTRERTFKSASVGATEKVVARLGGEINSQLR